MRSGTFKNSAKQVMNQVKKTSLQLWHKAQYFLSNNQLPENVRMEDILVSEGVIRRIAILKFPLILNGGFALRQYLTPYYKQYRYPVALEWVCAKNVNEEELNSWMLEVTSLQLGDEIVFKNFLEHSFWQSIDGHVTKGALTVDTELLADIIDGPTAEVGIEVDFSSSKLAPVSITYMPLIGEVFSLAKMCPLEHLLIGKLQQSIIAPRFEDIADITWLLVSARGKEINWVEVFGALEKFCHKNKASYSQIDMLKYLVGGNLVAHPAFHRLHYQNRVEMPQLWAYWLRDADEKYDFKLQCDLTTFPRFHAFTADSPFPKSWGAFHSQLTVALEGSGFMDYYKQYKIRP